ncbi:hypothetical protein [Megalodesulfovibrio gigas]|uniref:Uncharacterized protein n=1 Tax=Megalodesulfovibrio gigas (strain ATCC 19364 / DSM 1382 / NCIMB 9332 / VKM B-1759) TaxID=1121448 RepID=T2GGD1_MEGG1|nr:hypothetical protein [Megalodesulfovibrio gigas]AGW15281.1 hypothetical protein DGI_4070 [Megalodesulfovibrio gigas DSM 1382 = ATCC 19364]
MRMEWTIIKGRGNLRPVLQYTVTLTEFEKSLAVPMVEVESGIPKPPDAGWNFCWPGQHERGPWTPTEFHVLQTPNHRSGQATASLKLPWRADNLYPEVETSFLALREAFEIALTEAAQSQPFQVQGRLETSGEAKKHIAPAVAAARILHAVKG